MNFIESTCWMKLLNFSNFQLQLIKLDPQQLSVYLQFF